MLTFFKILTDRFICAYDVDLLKNYKSLLMILGLPSMGVARGGHRNHSSTFFASTKE